MDPPSPKLSGASLKVPHFVDGRPEPSVDTGRLRVALPADQFRPVEIADSGPAPASTAWIYVPA
jgi:hypothetical protein